MAFLFRLEKRRRDARRSTNAQSAVPDWRPGDTIPWAEEPLRVVGIRDDDADVAPVLVVEDVAQRATGDS